MLLYKDLISYVCAITGLVHAWFVMDRVSLISRRLQLKAIYPITLEDRENIKQVRTVDFIAHLLMAITFYRLDKPMLIIILIPYFIWAFFWVMARLWNADEYELFFWEARLCFNPVCAVATIFVLPMTVECDGRVGDYLAVNPNATQQELTDIMRQCFVGPIK